MARARFSKLMAAATLIGGAASVSACVEDEGMFYAYQLAIIQGGGFSCDEEFRAVSDVNIFTLADRGVVVVAGNATAVCVQNKIKSNRNGGVETSNIIMREYTLALNDGAPSAPRAMSGTVPADGAAGSAGLEGGRAPVLVEIFNGTQLTQAIQEAEGKGGSTQYVATVEFRGRTTGGIDVDSPEWSFPVNVNLLECYCEDPPFGGVPCPEETPGC